jgi:hypothetical protein
MDNNQQKITEQNIILKKCIDDSLMLSLNYDGYNSVEGLKKLIDEMVNILKSQQPMEIIDLKDRTVCPFCHKILRKS